MVDDTKLSLGFVTVTLADRVVSHSVRPVNHIRKGVRDSGQGSGWNAIIVG